MIRSKDFARAVGRKNMAETLNVGVAAISNAVARGKFPASWFSVCKELAERQGIDCPPSLFSQKSFSESTLVNPSQLAPLGSTS